MIKVCHMTSAHNSQDVRILKKQCVSLAKTGYETYLVARGDSYIESNVNVIGVGYDKVTRFKRIFFITRKIYKEAVKLNCDIYQIHDPELLPYALKLKRRGKKVIFDSHENIIQSIYEKRYLSMYIRKFIAKISDVYLKYVCKNINAIISVSPHITKYYEKVNHNVYMITNYPKLEGYNHQYNAKGAIVFTGGITEQWSHVNIINAINNNIDVIYEMYGPIDETYKAELLKIDTYNKVRYKGKVPHKDISKILSKSSIGMAILKYNLNAGGKIGTLGNTKIFEYMNAGLPIICTDFILWKDIVQKYKCGVCVDPNNVQEISDAINYLISNPDIAKEMGVNGRIAIENEFNWEKEEKKLIELYEKIIQE